MILNKLNNHKSNLRWVTNQENSKNQGERKNKSGHKYIYSKDKKYRFQYRDTIKKINHIKSFKTKKEALCYKYIFLLKIKSNIII